MLRWGTACALRRHGYEGLRVHVGVSVTHEGGMSCGPSMFTPKVIWGVAGRRVLSDIGCTKCHSGSEVRGATETARHVTIVRATLSLPYINTVYGVADEETYIRWVQTILVSRQGDAPPACGVQPNRCVYQPSNAWLRLLGPGPRAGPGISYKMGDPLSINLRCVQV